MGMGQKILYNYGTMDYLIKYKIYSSPECKKRQKGEFEEKKVSITIKNTPTSNSGTAKSRFLRSLKPELRKRINISSISC